MARRYGAMFDQMEPGGSEEQPLVPRSEHPAVPKFHESVQIPRTRLMPRGETIDRLFAGEGGGSVHASRSRNAHPTYPTGRARGRAEQSGSGVLGIR